MTSSEYHPQHIEQQAQQEWQKNQRFVQNEQSGKPKYYALAMFPYPSGKLHIGHARVYSITDLLARFYRMQGYQVLHPMGWDAFGLPAENAAIASGTHPATWTYTNIDDMRAQLSRLGCSYDWRREFATCDPAYYRWEQWLFTRMHRMGLAYRKESWVNWDPVDNTVLANEQVENGRGWRSGALVERKKLNQWNIRITAYADELLEGLNQVHWPKNVVQMQRNWIGKSSGAYIDFVLKQTVSTWEKLRVFTTRPDTLMGATYVSIAPDHPLIDTLAKTHQHIADFAAKCRVPREHDQEHPKEGIDTGLEVIHPLTSKTLPLWIANYVLMEYGTGVVMSVPAHDERDYEFAQTYNLPIVRVIAPVRNTDKQQDESGAFIEHGTCIHSGKYDGLAFHDAFQAIVTDLQKAGMGEMTTTYRLRDWGVSRQRYWGAPIPIIHCDDCGEVAVPDEQLPVELPSDIVPSGKGSPLADCPTFVNTTCPQCGKPAKRDTDTFDTFFESSWYYARFASYNQNQAMLDERAAYWCPVDQYVGGIEHAILHLLYARFFHRVMRDVLRDTTNKPIITSNEPFLNLLAQGMVLAPIYQRNQNNAESSTSYANALDLEIHNVHGERYGIHKTSGDRFHFVGIGKMSKSKLNGVEPDKIIDEFGADTLRLYLLFAAPPEQSLEWSQRGVVGMSRFLHRLWNTCQHYLAKSTGDIHNAIEYNDESSNLWTKANGTIYKVVDDIQRRRAFNTAIATIMELSNQLQRFDPKDDPNRYALGRQVAEMLVMLLAPFTPHICHVLWKHMGYETDLLDRPYPTANSEAIKQKTFTLVVQINGKVRSKFTMPQGSDEHSLQQAALNNQVIQKHLGEMSPAKIIVVPNKLVNIVVRV